MGRPRKHQSNLPPSVFKSHGAFEAKRQGLDPQKILGHNEARTTKIYLRGKEVEVVYGPIKRIA